MKKTILITSLMALMCGAVFAQPAGNQAGQEVAIPVVSEAQAPVNMTKAISNYLLEKNVKRGLNDNGFYYATGLASIEGNPSDNDYEQARNLAYQAAMADAKRSIANYYGQEVSTYLEKIYTEPMSADAQRREAEVKAMIDPGTLAKMKKLIDVKIEKELKKEGISYDSPKANSIIENLISSTSMKESIKRVSFQTISGLILAQKFEKSNEIAVVAYYSPATLSVAAAMNGNGKAKKVSKRQAPSLNQWLGSLDDETLYLGQGVQITNDEEGNMVLVSYGSSMARSKSVSSKNGAFEKAEQQATGNLSRFAAEELIANSETEAFMNSVELEDGSVISDIEDSLNSKITAKSNLKVPGVVPLHTWEYVTNTGKIICGTICIWSVKTATNALKQKGLVDKVSKPGGSFKLEEETTGIQGKKVNPSPVDNTIRRGLESDQF